MGKRLSLLAVLTVVMAALAFGACSGDDDAPEETPTPAGVKGMATPESELGKKINETLVPEESAEGKRLGPADAKVTILAYEDFGCPH
jgi:protein-disulfide isomerase